MTTPHSADRDMAELVDLLGGRDELVDAAQALQDLVTAAVPELDPADRRSVHAAGQALERARENFRRAAEMEARGETEVFDLRTWRKDG